MMALAILWPSPPLKAASVAPCLVLGDSIAVGIAPFKPTCVVAAKVGASSARILSGAPRKIFGRVYISAGSNDPLNPKLVSNLQAIRRVYPQAEVTWLAPRNSFAAQKVYQVAVQNRDKVIYLSKFKSNDGIHPKDYGQVARKL